MHKWIDVTAHPSSCTIHIAGLSTPRPRASARTTYGPTPGERERQIKDLPANMWQSFKYDQTGLAEIRVRHAIRFAS